MNFDLRVLPSLSTKKKIRSELMTLELNSTLKLKISTRKANVGQNMAPEVFREILRQIGRETNLRGGGGGGGWPGYDSIVLSKKVSRQRQRSAML